MLFNDFNDNVSDLKDNLQRIISKIEKNSRQIKDQTQLKVELVKEESKLSAQYRKLGEYVFKLKKENVEVDLDFEENTIAEIDRLLARIEAIKSKYEYIKSFSNFKSDEVREENKYIDE